jgi:class 3 adenylate cyclase
VEELNACFSKFDSIMEEFGLEKIKTIGDAYMAASGIPKASPTHAVDAVLAGLAIQHFMNDYMRARASKGKVGWELRLGIHSGPLVAGVIGKKKFAYDIWGDTVNTAARMESSGEVNRVNISAATYALVKDYFSCTHRGEVEAKNKGKLDMYFVDGLKGKFINLEAGDHQTHVPNSLFWQTVGKPIPSVAKA